MSHCRLVTPLFLPGIALGMALMLPAGASGGEPLPLKLTPRWDSSLGRVGDEWLVAFSKDGKLAFFDHPSGRLIARDTTTWKKAGPLLVGDEEIQRKSGPVVASPDGRFRAYAATSADRNKRGWAEILIEDLKTKVILARSIRHRHAPQLLLSDDGKTLVSASFDTIMVWDVPELAKRATLGPVGSNVRGLALSPDGQTLGVTCGAAGVEDQIWDLQTGTLKLTLGAGGGVQLWSLSFSREGKTLVSSGNDSQLRLWDAASGRNIRSIALDFDSRTQLVAFSPDGKTLAAGEQSLVRVFEAETGKPLFSLAGHTSVVRALAFSPDGKQLASASGKGATTKRLRLPAEPGEAIIWDLDSRKAVHVCKAHAHGTFAVAWKPDGTQIATAGLADPSTFVEKKDHPDRVVIFWDARTGKQVRSLPVQTQHGITQLAFSPNNKWLAADGTILDAQTGKELRSPSPGAPFAFSKDGELFATAGGSAEKGVIEIWDPSTDKCLARAFADRAGTFNAVAFHPSGESVAAASSVGVVWLWEIAGEKKK